MRDGRTDPLIEMHVTDRSTDNVNAVTVVGSFRENVRRKSGKFAYLMVGPTDQLRDCPTDGWTDLLIEIFDACL